jgi:hypothetical protein
VGFGLPPLLTKELKMARGHNLRGPFPLLSVTGDAFIYCVQFETNDTDPPDGIVQDDDGVAIARADTGDYTITFPSNRKPQAMLYGNAVLIEDLADYSAKVTGYTASTGVLTLSVYYDDGSPAVADTTDKTVAVFCVFCRNTSNA